MLKISKDYDHYTVELFQVNKLNTLFCELVYDQLRELVEERGSTVLFNLEGIRFIDSEGFRVLLQVSDISRLSGSAFKLCNVSEEVQELIRLQELESRFSYCSCKQVEEKILLELD